jgi:hypothetical protein
MKFNFDNLPTAHATIVKVKGWALGMLESMQQGGTLIGYTVEITWRDHIADEVDVVFFNRTGQDNAKRLKQLFEIAGFWSHKIYWAGPIDYTRVELIDKEFHLTAPKNMVELNTVN